MRWHGRRVQVYAYTQPTDMRKGFDGLCALVTQGLHRDPLGGDIFIVDFDGELGRPLFERRMKRSPLQDVTSLTPDSCFITQLLVRPRMRPGPRSATATSLNLTIVGSHVNP